MDREETANFGNRLGGFDEEEPYASAKTTTSTRTVTGHRVGIRCLFPMRNQNPEPLALARPMMMMHQLSPQSNRCAIQHSPVHLPEAMKVLFLMDDFVWLHEGSRRRACLEESRVLTNESDLGGVSHTPESKTLRCLLDCSPRTGCKRFGCRGEKRKLQRV